MTTALAPIAIGAVPGDGTGDEPRAGFTKIKSDHGNFLSAIGRRQTNPGTFGVSSAGSTTTLTDSTQSWATNQFAGQTLTVLTGPNAGYSKSIASNTASVVTLSGAINGVVSIGAAVGYQIAPSSVNAGSDGFATTAGAVGPNTVVDANQAWTANQWAGYAVTLIAGPFAGKAFPIASNTSSALTLIGAAGGAIAAGTPYVIGALTLALNDFSHQLIGTPGATQNDYNVGGLMLPGFDCLLLAAPSGGAIITGLNMTGVPDRWRFLIIETGGTDILEFPHQSSSSSLANRFYTSGGAGGSIPKCGSAIATNFVGIGVVIS